MKQKSNPIYKLLEGILANRYEANREFKAKIKRHQAKNNSAYFMLSLGQIIPVLTFDGREYSATSHHLSVYETYTDRVIVLSAFHYTAKLKHRGQDHTLHVYFDRNNRMRECLLNASDEKAKSLDFHREPSLQQLFQSFIAPFVNELFAISQDVEEKHLKRFREVESNIHTLSRVLFCGKLTKKTKLKQQDEYRELIGQQIKNQMEYNEIALNQNHGVIELLKKALDYLDQLPDEPVEPLKSEKSKPIKNINQPTEYSNMSSKKKDQRAEKESFEAQDEVDHNQIQLTDQMAQFERSKQQPSSASLLCFQYEILSRCFNFANGHQAIDILIEQNKVLALTQARMQACINFNAISDVTKLLTILHKIERAWIVTAALKNHFELLGLLLQKYQGPLFFSHDFQDLITIESLSTETCITLLRHGYDASTQDYLGFSLLTCASQRGDIKRVRALVDHGADVNYQMRGGTIYAYHVNPENGTKYHHKTGPKKAIQMHKGAETTLNTALHYAVDQGNIEICAILLDAGANWQLKNKKGITAESYLMGAFPDRPFPRELIELFIAKRKLNINAYHIFDVKEPTFTQTALSYAVQIDAIEWISGFLALGADPNLLTRSPNRNSCYNAFDSAAHRGNMKTLSLLLSETKVPITEESIVRIKNAPEAVRIPALDVIMNLSHIDQIDSTHSVIPIP